MGLAARLAVEHCTSSPWAFPGVPLPVPHRDVMNPEGDPLRKTPCYPMIRHPGLVPGSTVPRDQLPGSCGTGDAKTGPA